MLLTRNIKDYISNKHIYFMRDNLELGFVRIKHSMTWEDLFSEMDETSELGLR